MQWAELLPLLKGIGQGAFAGAVAAGAHYLRSVKEDGGLAKFEVSKFVRLVVEGAILGAIFQVPGIDMDTVEGFGILASITLFADTLGKIVERRLARPAFAKLAEAWKKFQEMAEE